MLDQLKPGMYSGCSLLYELATMVEHQSNHPAFERTDEIESIIFRYIRLSMNTMFDLASWRYFDEVVVALII